MITILNPWTGKTLETLHFTSAEEIRRCLDRSIRAFAQWKTSSARTRAQLLEQIAKELETRKSEFAELISKEVGKPISLALLEVERGIEVLQWAAAEALRFSGELIRLDATSNGRDGFGIHTRFPRGIILGITPYNFPLNLMIHKIAPALACGCSIVIKPSLFAPLTALKLTQLFQARIPDLVQTWITPDDVTAQLTMSPEIAYISFTGSPQIGRKIQKQAPYHPITLELGGNAWVILCEDISPDLFPSIARRIVSAGFGFAGQSCISVQNIAVANPIKSEFIACLKIETEKVLYGDPTSPQVISGPVIHAQAKKRILQALEKIPKDMEKISSTHSEGNVQDKDTMISPTLYINNIQNPTIPLPSPAQEELFGPIMFAHHFNQIEEVIGFVNSSAYGLQTGVYTHNWATIQNLYRELEVGGVIINDVPTTRYDHQPYGGIKESGVGREGLKYAMEEMTQSKFLALSSKVIGIG